MRSKWLKWVGWGAMALSILFMLAILWRSAGQLQDVQWPRFIVPMLAGLLLYGPSLLLQAVLWTSLVARLAGTSWGWWDLEVYFATHMARRIPGAPWYMAGRAVIYDRQRQNGRAALTASLVEWLGSLLTGVLWAAAIEWGAAAFGVATLIVALAALAWSRLRRWDRWPARWHLLRRLSPWWLLLLYAVYALVWLFGGGILALLVAAAGASESAGLFAVTSLWAVAGTISLLIVFVPVGLGIREVTLTVLLQSSMGSGMALVVALLVRVVFILGDLLWGGVAWFYARYRARRQAQDVISPG